MKVTNYLAAALLLIAPATFAAPVPAGDKDKDEINRMENAGTVIDEILNVPDDIPQDLLDKARCVVVLPSVLKAAFIVGACDVRAGRRQRRSADRRRGHGLRDPGNERPRGVQFAQKQSETRCGRSGCSRTEGPRRAGRYRRVHARGDVELLAFTWRVRGHLARGLDTAS